MIPKFINLIDTEDIQNLVTNQVSENRTLEYKRDIPGNKDKDKREFLADVSSFANSSGGDLIYGIDELRDNNNRPTGLPSSAFTITVENIDAEVRRLESIIISGLDPRIPNVRLKSIEGYDGGLVLIIRVPKSWASPHMVIYQNYSRFYARNASGKYQLDVQEIRSAFFTSENLRERLRNFRIDRIAQISSGESPIPLKYQSHYTALHLIPLSALDNYNQNDYSRDYSNYYQALHPMCSGPVYGRFNFDGYLCPKSSDSYVQCFRSGIIESIDVNMLTTAAESRGVLGILNEPNNNYELNIIKSLESYLNVMREINIDLPIIIMLSLIGVRGFKMLTTLGDGFRTVRGDGIDKNDLIIPEILLESYDIDLEFTRFNGQIVKQHSLTQMLLG